MLVVKWNTNNHEWMFHWYLFSKKNRLRKIDKLKMILKNINIYKYQRHDAGRTRVILLITIYIVFIDIFSR